MVRVWVLTTLLMASIASPAWAQSSGPTLRPRGVSIAAGVLFDGAYEIGDRAAELRRNTIGPAVPTTFFNTMSDIERATGFEGRLGFALTRHLAIEFGGAIAKPMLNVTIIQDPEAETTVVTDELTRYRLDVSGLWFLPSLQIGSRARPFLLAGGGSLWELHQDRLVVERGNLFHAGGGVQYWIRGGDARRRSLGLRGEVRMVRRTGGIEFAESARTYPTIGILGFAGF
jgi:hypothetical protein